MIELNVYKEIGDDRNILLIPVDQSIKLDLTRHPYKIRKDSSSLDFSHKYSTHFWRSSIDCKVALTLCTSYYNIKGHNQLYKFMDMSKINILVDEDLLAYYLVGQLNVLDWEDVIIAHFYLVIKVIEKFVTTPFPLYKKDYNILYYLFSAEILVNWFKEYNINILSEIQFSEYLRLHHSAMIKLM